jgi:hypothetical protein
MLKITNNNTFDLTDRYDGEDYTFPAGKTVRCPVVVAQHFFGIGNPNKMPYLSRQGWARHSQEFDAGMLILNNFAFEEIDLGPQDDLALNAQGAAHLQSADDGEGETDGSHEASSATLPKNTRPTLTRRLAPA